MKAALYILLVPCGFVIIILSFFGGPGVVAMIWGSSVLDRIMASPPDRSHPAFWVCLAVMLVTTASATVAWILLMLPLWEIRGVRIQSKDPAFRILRWYAVKVSRLFQLDSTSESHCDELPSENVER